MSAPSHNTNKPRLSRPSHWLAGLALGMAGMACQAQSSVTLYGLVDLSAGRFQSPGGASANAMESGKMTTSYWGLKGTEDLGGGMSAVFAIESFMRADTGSAGRFNADTLWARNAYVGVSNPMGTVTLGRNTTSLFVSVLVFNALGDSFGFSPAIRHYFTSGTVTGDTGWSDSVKYTSPRWGGATFSAHAAAGEGVGGRNGGLSAMYFSGPLGATLAWQKVTKGTEADTTTFNLGGSYDLGPAKLFAQYGKVDNLTTQRDFKILGLGASINAGGGKVLAQWGRVTPTAGAKLRTMTVGYDYFLSKRTDLYGMVMSEARTGVSNGNSMAVGMRHRF